MRFVAGFGLCGFRWCAGAGTIALLAAKPAAATVASNSIIVGVRAIGRHLALEFQLLPDRVVDTSSVDCGVKSYTILIGECTVAYGKAACFDSGVYCWS